MTKSTVNRRRFLLLGTTFIAGLFSSIPLKLMRSPVAKTTARASSSALASIGFWHESRQLPSLQPVSWRSVAPNQTSSNLIAARALPESDRTFLSQGAKVYIQGLYSAAHVRSLDVYAHFPAAADHDGQKVCVWSFKSSPVLSASAPVSFVMPVSQADGLTLSLVWRYHTADGSVLEQEAIAPFALTGAADTAKLQRGVYLLGGRDADGQPPDWQTYQLRVVESDRDDQQHQLVPSGGAHPADASAPFPYVLVAFDYPIPQPTTAT